MDCAIDYISLSAYHLSCVCVCVCVCVATYNASIHACISSSIHVYTHSYIHTNVGGGGGGDSPNETRFVGSSLPQLNAYEVVEALSKWAGMEDTISLFNDLIKDNSMSHDCMYCVCI